jgi:imidazolonepropionase-like amidohydrolase
VDKRLILHGGLLIDGTGSDTIAGSSVVIDEGLIVYAGPAAGAPAQGDAEVIDLRGATVMPGIIDCHVHLGGTDSSSAHDWVLENDTYQAIVSVKQAEALLAHGVTTVRDISKNGLQLKKATAAGIVRGPRIVACGPGLTRTGGHGDWLEFPVDMVQRSHPWGLLCDGADQVRAGVRQLMRMGSDCIKVWASGGGLWDKELATDQHYSLEELTVITEEAAYIGLPVAAHAECVPAAKAALQAGVNTIEHGYRLDEECVQLMKQKQVTLVPTLALLLQWFEGYEYYGGWGDRLDLTQRSQLLVDNFAMVREAGVRFAVGSDSYANRFTPFGETSLREVRSLVDAGATEMEAVVAATKTAAEALRIDQTVGTLEAGKAGDVVVLSANPLEDISELKSDNVLLIVKQGEVYKRAL